MERIQNPPSTYISPHTTMITLPMNTSAKTLIWVDATIECKLNDNGESYPVSVTVTAVDEDTEQVRFDFEVGDLME